MTPSVAIEVAHQVRCAVCRDDKTGVVDLSVYDADRGAWASVQLDESQCVSLADALNPKRLSPSRSEPFDLDGVLDDG